MGSPQNTPMTDSSTPPTPTDFTKTSHVQGAPAAPKVDGTIPVSKNVGANPLGMPPGGPMPFAKNPRTEQPKPYK